MEFVIYLTLVLFGLVLGSFAGASVWRLRARQLVADKKNGDPVDHVEYTKLKHIAHEKVSNDHSLCLHCGYKLRWYDLIPLVSWIMLRGRCRRCRQPIGIMEPLIELGMATFFVLSYVLWPFDLTSGLQIAQFIMWLIAGVGLGIMFAYDARWFLLPNKINIAVIILGITSVLLMIIGAPDHVGALFNVLGSVAVLSGIYFVLYLVSKGRWIGFGDIKLGLGLGLLLGDWKLAVIGLFFANLIGCLIVIPLMIKGKLKRNSHVPFGPLLIAGAIIAKLVGMSIVEFYTLSLM
ncbi:MAG: prepilin peptidase [Candidatus Microsaccharimonas sossegonensis]|uniref:Prepilin peptidase n=1 Tax=Candidatus Microsaccharimonas sossegonensis TaxID=2506948 RepID=A0A4Q0AHL4_9BACT|nr:MAG: prepilin peptidase [Candidatus Microsaccharimonas sossegonensis]